MIGFLEQAIDTGSQQVRQLQPIEFDQLVLH
jgi:hypothetical protein